MPKQAKEKRRRERERKRAAAGQLKPTVIKFQTIYGGKAEVEIIRDADPNGDVVEHAVRRDASVADRMFRAGSLGNADGVGRKLHDAAEVFRRDFERGRLSGQLAAADLMRSGGGGQGEISDFVVAARERVRAALVSLGFAVGRDRGSWTGKAAWWVLGVGNTLEAFSERMRWGGVPMTSNKASGLVISAIERLAIHYGIIGVKAAEQNELRRAEGRGMMSAARSLQRQVTAELAEARHCRERRAKLTEDGVVDLEVFRAIARERLGHLASAKTLRASAEDLLKRGRRIAGEPPKEPEPPVAARPAPGRPVLVSSQPHPQPQALPEATAA